MGDFIGVLLFFLFIFCVVFIKKVPPNTAVIIDRNNHYLKTVRKGFYFFRHGSDKVTTTISTNPHTQMYSQISETHDGLLYGLQYSVTYKVYNINSVLESLKSNRRSVNDIIQSCVHTSVGNFEKQDMARPSDLITEIKRRLAVNLDSFEIELISFDLYTPRSVSNSMRSEMFAPHISEGIKSIKYK